MTVIADTGAVYALIDRSDAWHERVAQWWTAADRSPLLPVSVIPEISYLLHTRIGAHADAAFTRALADGELEWTPIEQADVVRAAELQVIYESMEIGFVDASVVAVAERFGATTILTTERRHFSVMRPRHRKSFALVP